jgi:hypothetical protein
MVQMFAPELVVTICLIVRHIIKSIVQTSAVDSLPTQRLWSVITRTSDSDPEPGELVRPVTLLYPSTISLKSVRVVSQSERLLRRT